MAQNFEDVEFTTTEEFVIVSYDLVNCPSSWSYDIRVEAELIDKRGNIKTIVAKTTDGDKKKVKCGKNKTIRWRVFEDEDELEGDLSITVRIIDSHYFGSSTASAKKSNSDLAGPEAALYSLLLPGWGDFLVSNRSDAAVTGVLFAGTYVLSLYCALQSYGESQEYYTIYREATTQELMDTNYELANSKYQTSKAWLGVAGAVLAVDLTYVLVRGVINKNNKRRGYSFLEKIDVNFQYVDNGFGVGFKTKF